MQQIVAHDSEITATMTPFFQSLLKIVM